MIGSSTQSLISNPSKPLKVLWQQLVEGALWFRIRDMLLGRLVGKTTQSSFRIRDMLIASRFRHARRPYGHQLEPGVFSCFDPATDFAGRSLGPARAPL